MEKGNLIDPSSSLGILKIPIDPAIVINKLPSLSSSELNFGPCDESDLFREKFTGFGEWLEGREVRKMFDNKYFNGKVTQFDQEMGWYKIDYEDGDFEDLEWHELKDVLVPLDVSSPLKTLATNIIRKRKRQQSDQKTEKVKAKARRYGKSNGNKSG